VIPVTSVEQACENSVSTGHPQALHRAPAQGLGDEPRAQARTGSGVRSIESPPNNVEAEMR